jgi:hypothetical protein
MSKGLMRIPRVDPRTAYIKQGEYYGTPIK